jgi:hypothetical protein
MHFLLRAVVVLLMLATQARADPPHMLRDIIAPQDPSQFIARENALRHDINDNFLLGNAANPTFPWAKMRIGILAPPGAATDDVLFTLVTAAPVQTDLKAFYVLHQTNGVPLSGINGMYGGIFAALQDIRSTVSDIDEASPSYVGMFGTGRATAAGGEGGVDTTLAAPANPGDMTITVVDSTGFVDGKNLQIVTDLGTVSTNTVSGAPVGNVITLSTGVGSAAGAGNLVYRWKGSVKGLGAQSSVASGSTGMLMGSAEFSMTAEAGSQPYIKWILALTSNHNDAVSALGPYDTGLMFSRAGASVGTKTGIAFSPVGGHNLVNTGGTLIKAFLGAYTGGIDFSTSTFSGTAWSSPGFIVDGIGNNYISNAAPQQRLTNTGVSISAGGLWRKTVSNVGTVAWQVNTAVAGDFSSAITPLLLTPTGGVLASSPTAIATNSTDPFLYIPTMTGPPTGAPASAAAGRTAIVWDSTNKKFCAYNQPTTAWECSAAFSP